MLNKTKKYCISLKKDTSSYYQTLIILWVANNMWAADLFTATFLPIFYAFVLQNTLYGSQNYAHNEFMIFQSFFVQFGSFQDVFS